MALVQHLLDGIESTRYPCAMVAPNGDSARARSGST